ncbi:MAG: DUF1566 domain-containing protein [Gammaproteobacteria bacterium]|nr:DUF1566 domain-containing protein [Gammaproteobacteria bacterium]
MKKTCQQTLLYICLLLPAVFSYVRAAGPFQDNGDGTVTHESLIWQQQDDGIQKNKDDAQAYCEGLTLAGYGDWRLPGIGELAGLSDYSKTDPAIDTTVFPGTHSSGYWSGSADVHSQSYGWYVKFDAGYVTAGSQGFSRYVRCVRGPETAPPVFNLDADTATNSGITWQREGGEQNWQDAQSYCENLALAGYDDWYLPGIEELGRIADYSGYKPAIDTVAFPGTQPSSYWSGSSYVVDTNQAWAMDFNGGSRTWHSKAETHYVRCARVETPVCNLNSLLISAIPGSGPEPLAVDFSSILSAGSSFCAYAWDFGDGAAASTANPSHVYNDPGSYAAILTVTDGMGGSLSESVTIPVYVAESFQDNGDRTVTDTNTGLIWQQQDNGGRRTWNDAQSYCESLTLAGRDDWRLPSVHEFSTLLDYRRHHPAIDTVFFPDAHSDDPYWSGSVLTNASDNAWYLNFSNGKVDWANADDNYYYVRCSSGSFKPAPIVRSEDTATDTPIGLVWQRRDDGAKRNRQDARRYCEDLSLAGYDDWRLPGIEELERIVDYGHSYPAIDRIIFPDTRSSGYWSVSEDVNALNSAWLANFRNGTVVTDDTADLYYVRCARWGFGPLYSLTVSRQGNGLGTVSFDPGMDCDKECTGEYNSGEKVILTAIPGEYSDFVGWSGACSGSDCSLTMNQAQEVTADFALKKYRLSVSKDAAGEGTVFGVGIDCGTDCTEEYEYGNKVILTAAPDADFSFDGWDGACLGTNLSCQTDMTRPREVIARFSRIPSDTLSVSLQGNGAGIVTGDGIACGADCTQEYSTGTTVTLTAAPGEHSDFVGWSGACAGTAPACVLSMEQAQNVSADFSLKKYPLSVNRSGNGSISGAGIACGSDCTEEYDAKTAVTLTARPDAGASFDRWSGVCLGTNLICEVTMDSAREAAANFVIPLPNTLTVSNQGNGSVTTTGTDIDVSCGIDCAEEHASGTQVSLEANPEDDSVFVEWQGDCSGSDPVCILTTGETQTVIAEFIPKKHKIIVSKNPENAGDIMGPGIACGSDCTEEYDAGTTVGFIAEPKTGYAFVGWEGACTDTNLLCELTMEKEENFIIAGFALIPQNTLSVSVEGGGTVTSSEADIDCGSNGVVCSSQYDSAIQASLHAAPAAYHEFIAWDGDCRHAGGNPECLPESTHGTYNVIARFKRIKYPLTVINQNPDSGNISGAGIACGSDCEQDYPGGDEVIISAKPEADYLFSGWGEGNCIDSANGALTCRIDMTSSRSVTVSFMREGTYALSVSVQGDGLVASRPAGINCPGECAAEYFVNSEVVLSAAPVSKSAVFLHWDGACSGSAPECTLVMDRVQSLSANFVEEPGTCPPLQAAAIASDSELLDTEAIFSGCITVNDGQPQKIVETASTESVHIIGVIAPDPAHLGQTADILAAEWYTSLDAGEHAGQFFILRQEGEALLLNGESSPELPAFRENVQLSSAEYRVEISRLPLTAGVRKLYFGYRLNDGDIMFNTEPLEITVKPPFLENASVSGDLISRDTSAGFSGGVSVNGEPEQKNTAAGFLDRYAIKGFINVEASHAGLIADVLAVPVFLPLSGGDTMFFPLNEDGDDVPWETGNIDDLAVFKAGIELREILFVEVPRWSPRMNGVWHIYFGYRLDDGAIVFNGEAIAVTVN